jgi:hypothetical protein
MNLARVACVVVLSSVVVSAQAKDPVAGAWEQTAQKNLTTGTVTQLQAPPLQVIYANGHFVQFTAASDRKKIDKPTAEMTKDELVDRLRMQGQFGTYRIQGTQLVKKIVAATGPSNVGREATLDVRVEGDTLITTGQNAAGEKTESRYRKLK